MVSILWLKLRIATLSISRSRVGRWVQLFDGAFSAVALCAWPGAVAVLAIWAIYAHQTLYFYAQTTLFFTTCVRIYVRRTYIRCTYSCTYVTAGTYVYTSDLSLISCMYIKNLPERRHTSGILSYSYFVRMRARGVKSSVTYPHL